MVADSPIVRVEGLKKSFGSTVALAGVDMKLERGTVFGLLGRNGAGKTTLVRILAVLHELGHAWQWRSGRLDRLSAEMAPWGYRDMAGLEAGADCISVVWGASPRVGHYWACPPAAVRLVARRLAGDWGS